MITNNYGDIERTISTKNPEDFVCKYCGCDEVQSDATVDLNTKEFISFIDSDDYCPDCCSETTVVKRKDFTPENDQTDESEGL